MIKIFTPVKIEIQRLDLKLGDKLAVILPEETKFEDANSLAEQMRKTFPDIDFIFIVGKLEFKIIHREEK